MTLDEYYKNIITIDNTVVICDNEFQFEMIRLYYLPDLSLQHRKVFTSIYPDHTVRGGTAVRIFNDLEANGTLGAYGSVDYYKQQGNVVITFQEWLHAIKLVDNTNINMFLGYANITGEGTCFIYPSYGVSDYVVVSVDVPLVNIYQSEFRPNSTHITRRVYSRKMLQAKFNENKVCDVVKIISK